MRKIFKPIFFVLALMMVLTILGGCSSPQSTNVSPEPSDTPDPATGQENEVQMLPGTYEVTVASIMGPMDLAVTVTEDKIEKIEILQTLDNVQMITAVKEDMIPVIIENQSVNVDGITGATLSSGAVVRGVKQALEQAQAPKDAFNNKVETVAVQDDRTVDVVVVGSGASGLSTAVQLANRSNLNVLLLEKNGYLGGTSGVSGGGIWTSQTQYNKEFGIDFTPDELVEAFYKASGEGFVVNEGLARNIAEISSEIFLEYLDAGMSWDVTRYSSSNPTFAVIWPEERYIQSYETNLGGWNLVTFLKEQAESKGVEIAVNAKVTELLTEDGAVVGVKVGTDNNSYNVYAKKVVLATGGLTRNLELMAKYYPDFIGIVPHSGAGSTGDGIILTESLDAAIAGDGLGISIGEGPALGYSGPYGSIARSMQLIVNKDGERFFDETDRTQGWQKKLLDNGNKNIGITDSTNANVDRLENAVKDGFAKKADSFEELAKQLGVPETAFAEAMNQYNEAYKNGTDDIFTPHGKMKPLLEAPFYAMNYAILTNASLTGLKVNENCMVLTNSGAEIENLYAVGELVIGNLFNNYPSSGSAIGSGIYEGAIVAIDITEKLNK